MLDQWSPTKAALLGFVSGALMYVFFGSLVGPPGPSEPGTDLLEFCAFAGTGIAVAVAVATGRNRLVRHAYEQFDHQRKINIPARDKSTQDESPNRV